MSQGNYPHTEHQNKKIDTPALNTGTQEEMIKALEEYIAQVLQPTTPETWVENYPSTLEVAQHANTAEDLTTNTAMPTPTKKTKRGPKRNTRM